MTPTDFPQANITLRPPSDLDESQCRSISACKCKYDGGNLDGSEAMIVAWQPSPEDLHKLMDGSPIFIGFLGGVPPHFVTAEFPAQMKRYIVELIEKGKSTITTELFWAHTGEGAWRKAKAAFVGCHVVSIKLK